MNSHYNINMIYIKKNVNYHYKLKKTEILIFTFLRLDRIFFFFVCLFRAEPRAYGSWIGAVAASLHNSNSRSSHICDLHHCSWQCQILNPLIGGRDWTCLLMDASQICFHWAMELPRHKIFTSMLGTVRQSSSQTAVSGWPCKQALLMIVPGLLC